MILQHSASSTAPTSRIRPLRSAPIRINTSPTRFATPLTGCGFVDLKPETEYEVEVRSKNEQGESDPVSARIRTNPEGSIGI